MKGTHLVVEVEAHEALLAAGGQLRQVAQIVHLCPVELLHLRTVQMTDPLVADVDGGD